MELPDEWRHVILSPSQSTNYAAAWSTDCSQCCSVPDSVTVQLVEYQYMCQSQ